MEQGTVDLLDDLINTTHADLAVRAMFDKTAREEMRVMLLKEHKKLVNEDNVDDYLSELVGLGVFETIIEDDTITDIGWNGTDLWIETPMGKKKNDGAYEVNDAYIRKIIQRFANYAGKDFSEKNPILNTQLDNIRINAMHNVISPAGTTMSMRMARNSLFLTEQNFHLIANPKVYGLLKDLIQTGANVVITGETGTGKTELQKLLIGMIPDDEKIVMIEDTLETHLKEIYPQKDILSWLILEGISHTEMIKQSLRNHPKWVVLSEARDHVIYEIHQSVLTNHKIILTAHAFNAHAFPSRMIGMTKQQYDVDEKTIHQELLHYYDLGIHFEKRQVDGRIIRYIDEVVEYTPSGLKTLYKQDLILDINQTEYVMEEAFSDLSIEKKNRLHQFGIESSWSKQFDEVEQ